MAHSKARQIKDLKAKYIGLKYKTNHLRKLLNKYHFFGSLRPSYLRFFKLTKRFYLAILKK